MKYIILGVLLLVVTAIIGYLFIPYIRYKLIPITGGTQQPSPDVFPPGSVWINSQPLSLKELEREGKYTLIDFWTYTCINCIRANPHTQELWERYKDYGLMVIGVHSPEFKSIEADPKNIAAAAKRAGLTYPIVVDSSMKIWHSFGNHFWPGKYLINPQGKVIYTQFGEGNYKEEEEFIRSELAKGGLKLPQFKETKPFLTLVSKQETPELYAGPGFIRQPYGNDQSVTVGLTIEFTLPKTIKEDRIYLEGMWLGAHDYMESESPGKIILNYLANAPYIVLDTANGPLTIEVLLDNHPVPDQIQGSDIKREEGKTVMNITEPRLYYPIAEHAPYGRHSITFIVPPGLRFYSFTFGTYAS